MSRAFGDCSSWQVLELEKKINSYYNSGRNNKLSSFLCFYLNLGQIYYKFMLQY